MIYLDLDIKDGSRACYSRVCVEVDPSHPLLGKYVIDDHVFRVEYESLENLCYFCGHYGHKLETCPSLVEYDQTSAQHSVIEKEKPSLDDETKETVG
ncbi:hypothetical protein LINPERPRIM_LOCUS37258 [Linum perenne]